MQEYIISDQYDGSPRKLYKTCCAKCHKDVWQPLHRISKNKNSFCSSECYKSFREVHGKRVEVNCHQCNKTFKRFQHHLAKIESKRYFCSRECQSTYFTKQKPSCTNCQKPLTGKSQKYCSNKCQGEHTFLQTITKWQAGELSGINAAEACKDWLKRYLIQTYGNKCSRCGWCEVNPTTGKVPIQIDHIDGNYKNNKEENLRLLCPNCHSLTPTYGALNKGKGREKRRLKLQSNHGHAD